MARTHCHSHNVRKNGVDRSKARRYRCLDCRRSFIDTRHRPLKSVRIPLNQAVQVLSCLVEGVGIRSTSRLLGLHKATVQRVILQAGAVCSDFLDRNLRNVRCNYLEIDELWTFIQKKQRRVRPEEPRTWGDAYPFYGIDMETKLIIGHAIGKRNGHTAFDLMRKLAHRIEGSAGDDGCIRRFRRCRGRCLLQPGASRRGSEDLRLGDRRGARRLSSILGRCRC